MKQKNSTDLHIQFTNETGLYFQWHPKNNPKNHSGTGYTSEAGYRREYAQWLEEKYLELLNNQINQEKLIEEMDAELESAAETINALEEEIEGMHADLAGADY